MAKAEKKEKSSARDIGIDVPVPERGCPDAACPVHVKLAVRGQAADARELRRDPHPRAERVKGLPGRQTRALPKGSRIECIDNTGAKIVEIVEVPKYRGVRKRRSSAGVARPPLADR